MTNDALQKLLQNPRVWRGQDKQREQRGFTSGYPKLDQHLPEGGWPLHALTEILLDHYGCGELQLLMPALARLSHGRESDNEQDGWIAWINPPFEPYAPALLQWGVDLSRVLLVRPKTGDDVLWAAEQALSCGNCAAVLVWSDKLNDVVSRRLQLAAEKGHSWAIAFRSTTTRTEPSAAALRIELMPSNGGTDLGILKSRGGRPVVVKDYAG